MSAPRPSRLVAVVGTGTDVGKTWVTCDLIRHLRASGLVVHARKPVQSFAPDSGPTDADLLAAATGELPESVCPRHRWYELAMAPPMAAEALGRERFVAADLGREIEWPAGVDVGFVETAGGVRSPVAADADSVGLASGLDPDTVLLVADAGLGTIGAVRLAVATMTDLGSTPVVHLNRFDADADLHRRNVDWLRERDGVTVSVASATTLAALGLTGVGDAAGEPCDRFPATETRRDQGRAGTM